MMKNGLSRFSANRDGAAAAAPRWLPGIALSAVCLAALPAAGAEKSLIDFFLPMDPQGPLVSEGIWGESAVLPRDVQNGLEDSRLEQWCYWDGKIILGDDGRYHLYASRWSQAHSHSRGRQLRAQAVHAVSSHPLGPYEDLGLIWPDWQEGRGHNITALRMHDGRYAVVSSDITPGTVFAAESPDGPYRLLGEIEYDANGFDPALARPDKPPRHMSNVQILLRPDGRYMIMPRSGCVMISEEGILGPYRIVAGPIYKEVDSVPQTRMEDPAIWHSGGMYHAVINYWRNDTAYHFTSMDGIQDWTYRGIAHRHKEGVFRYTDGTTNNWAVVQRPNVLIQDGHPTHFSFSVVDCTKGEDGPHDSNGSKVVVVPFDGKGFDRYLEAARQAEAAEEAAD